MRQIAYDSEVIRSFVVLIVSVSLPKQHERARLWPPAALNKSADNQLVTFCCQDDY